MLKTIAIITLLLFTLPTYAQTYTPSWESLDTRPVPQWFRDAKFGIFIHWGVYAVPGYVPKGRYAEWYLNALKNGDKAVQDYHEKRFGNRSYYDLAEDFKAELFKPEEWANVFEKSGAKYIVLTSKHHDGFCLWPDASATQAYGRPWNAVEAGPKRNLLGELFAAVRKTSVRPGMYYSLYEWYHPLWLKDKKAFAQQHTWPQMKTLINEYQPDVFWTDGEWDAADSIWKSQQFLTWLYNESPVKDRVVTYDRWGIGIRFHHGGVYTPEYQPELDFEDHYWEESRGMGFSYGYNREEDSWDYNSTQSLVLNLVDKVSRGGNFLLDIGPDEHGKIPPIMQERLLGMGEWLSVNGEAIYNTVRWKTPSQWGEGRTDYKPTSKSGDVLLKLTVDPDPGYAVKEIFFTWNPTSNALYGIFPRYPSNRKLVLKDITLPAQTAISFLSTKKSLTWQQVGNNVEVSLPEYDPNTIKAPYAYAIKIENYGKFAARPHIKVNYDKAPTKPVVSITAATGSTIHYTTDGSTPTTASPVYQQPISPREAAVVKAVAIEPGALVSSITSEEAEVYQKMPAVKARNLKEGIAYKYYETSTPVNAAAVESLTVKQSGTLEKISLQPKQRRDQFAFVYQGFVKIPANGVYTFFTASDDGSKLFIDGKEIVNNDGDHGVEEKSGRAWLERGFHAIKVIYFDNGGGNQLEVNMQVEGGKKATLGPLFTNAK